jgi:hypothetical protein
MKLLRIIRPPVGYDVKEHLLIRYCTVIRYQRKIRGELNSTSTATNIRKFYFFLSLCAKYSNEGNKLPLTPPVSVKSLIWQHFSTSEGHLQGGSIKYIKGILYHCN